MRRALRGVPWGLLTAGALVVNHPLVAHAADVLPPGSVAPHAAPAARVEEPNRADEFQVQLAWLADPVTFSYQLVATRQGNQLEVRGYVPNEAIRGWALQVARSHTKLNVVDQLQIHPGLATRCGGEPADSLRQAAQTALATAFPGQAANWTVEAEPGGKISVSGSVSSPSSQLAVSQCLRRLRGCTCVANQMVLASSTPSPAVPGTPPASTSPYQPARAQQPSPAVPPATQTGQRPPPPSLPPGGKSAAFGTETRWQEPQQLSLANGATLPPVLPTADKPAAVPPAVASLPSTPARSLPAPAATGASPYGIMPVSWGTNNPVTPPAPSQATSSPYQVTAAAKPSQPQSSAAPATPSWLVQSQPASAVPNRGSAAHQEGPASTPSQKVNASGPSDAPYVTTGLVIFPEDAFVAGSLSPLDLKGAIEKVCGPGVRGLEVVPRSPTSVEIRFKVKSPEEGERLSGRILMLPELGKAQVSFQVQIEP